LPGIIFELPAGFLASTTGPLGSFNELFRLYHKTRHRQQIVIHSLFTNTAASGAPPEDGKSPVKPGWRAVLATQLSTTNDSIKRPR
jgi:hypothetical protein